MNKYLIALVIPLLLFGCGGGGSDSGGGGGEVVADIEKYSGDYSGTVTQRLTDSSGSRVDTFTLLVTIREDGLIVTDVPGTGSLTQCRDEPPIFLTSNPLNFSLSMSDCVVVGSTSICSEDVDGTATATGTEIFGSLRGRVDCPEGSLAFEQNFRVTRR